MLLNKKGQTAAEVINNELKNLSLNYTKESKRFGIEIALEIRGRINLAAEFGLITKEEWEDFIDKIFVFLRGE